MTDTTIDQEAEALLRAASSRLTDPREAECLLCYVVRMLDDFGCTTRLRWARHYRDLRAPRATALEVRLLKIGGICDCRILAIGYRFAAGRCHVDGREDRVAPGTRPSCAGVRRGSTRPCGPWPRPRWPW